MAVLYLVASWILLQVADVGVSLLGLPDWVGKTVFLFLALGFFPALIFSWVYEMTPEGLRREKDIDRSQSITHKTGQKINVLIVVMLALAIAAVVFDRLIPEQTQEAPVSAEVTSSEAGQDSRGAEDQVPEASIAVLPFENFSGEKEDEYFSDGLADTVLHQLAQVPGLKVIARNSSFQFKGTNLDVREVGERLGVANLLEGSVQRYGDQIRVIAQLVSTSDGAHVWSQSFDYKMDDIFALHDAIALAVTEQMKLSLLAEDAARIDLGGTKNPEAYDLRLQAMGALFSTFNPAIADQVDPDENYPPMELLDRALALDPEYVDALNTKVYIYNMFAFQTTSIERKGRFMMKARPLAERALELAPDYSGAWAAKGTVEHRVGNTAEAIAAFRKAIALNPNDADAHQGLAVAAHKDPLVTIEHMQIARKLDPENPFNRPTVLALASLGRIDEAIAELESGVTGISHIDQMIFHDLADIHLFARGRPDESAPWAGKLLALQPDSLRGAIAMVRVWLAVGDLDRAQRWMSTVGPEGKGSDRVNVYRFNLAIAKGNLDAATEVLQSMAQVPGPMRGLELAMESGLCVIKAEYECARAATTGFGQALDQMEARGRVMPGARAQQQLAMAIVVDRTDGSPEAHARAVVDMTSSRPRAAWPEEGINYTDAEAFVLLDKTELALSALKESLLKDDGFLPWDTFWLYPDNGVVLSDLDGEPGFEDWKKRFRARRDAARERMIAMETAGEIPTPRQSTD